MLRVGSWTINKQGRYVWTTDRVVIWYSVLGAPQWALMLVLSTLVSWKARARVSQSSLHLVQYVVSHGLCHHRRCQGVIGHQGFRRIPSGLLQKKVCSLMSCQCAIPSRVTSLALTQLDSNNALFIQLDPSRNVPRLNWLPLIARCYASLTTEMTGNQSYLWSAPLS